MNLSRQPMFVLDKKKHGKPPPEQLLNISYNISNTMYSFSNTDNFDMFK